MGEHRRRCGIDPVRAGVVLPVEIAKQLDPIQSGKESGSVNVGAVPHGESTKEVDPITTGAIPPGKRANKAHAASARPNTGVPAADEGRYIPNEVLVELPPNILPGTINSIAREQLKLIAFQRLPLVGTTMYRYGIASKRSVVTTIASLETDRRITAVQPNYLYTLESEAAGALAEAQYAVPKMRLTEAHALSSVQKHASPSLTRVSTRTI
jgi:hypothetical protein